MGFIMSRILDAVHVMREVAHGVAEHGAFEELEQLDLSITQMLHSIPLAEAIALLPESDRPNLYDFGELVPGAKAILIHPQGAHHGAILQEGRHRNDSDWYFRVQVNYNGRPEAIYYQYLCACCVRPTWEVAEQFRQDLNSVCGETRISTVSLMCLDYWSDWLFKKDGQTNWTAQQKHFSFEGSVWEGYYMCKVSREESFADQHVDILSPGFYHNVGPRDRPRWLSITAPENAPYIVDREADYIVGGKTEKGKRGH